MDELETENKWTAEEICDVINEHGDRTATWHEINGSDYQCQYSTPPFPAPHNDPAGSYLVAIDDIGWSIPHFIHDGKRKVLMFMIGPLPLYGDDNTVCPVRRTKANG